MEVHSSRSDIFPLYFCEKKVWQKYRLLMQKKSKIYLNQWEPMGFYKLQRKKCEEISTVRLRHVNYFHSSSIYPQESENTIEKWRKSKVKRIATIAS